ncbi:RICIN domain-containing protein [Lentzea terrae]|uniref:RICIN domain-containing protein n=1 Tax=Lentzea terrae TaxID=2200761 RepID=UPI0018E4EE8C|nr:RICIN domain-containing protein [Lentzea terrae]
MVKCLDVRGGGTANGTLVQLRTCRVAGINQTWMQRTLNRPAGVYFQDTGAIEGWDRAYEQKSSSPQPIRRSDRSPARTCFTEASQPTWSPMWTVPTTGGSVPLRAFGQLVPQPRPAVFAQDQLGSDLRPG